MITQQTIKELGLPLPQNTLIRQTLLKYLRIDAMNHLCGAYANYTGIEFIDKVFEHLNIHVEVSEADLANIPQKGPFIAISNHPFGFLDGLVMLLVLSKRNPDFKVLANFFLRSFDQLDPFFIELNPFQKADLKNVSGLKQAYSHLQNGSPLGIFPAGEVATIQNIKAGVVEKIWDPSIVRFIAKANVPVVPVFFSGTNSWVFHALGKIHPMLRTLSIPSEFFKKEHNTVKMRIGNPILVSQLNKFDKFEDKGRFLRTSVLALNPHRPAERAKLGFGLNNEVQPLIEPVATHLLDYEIEQLKNKGGLLIEKAEYQVYLSPANNIPNVLRELGRLREQTFRHVGEGTNKAIDIDKYDAHYLHLFAWDAQQKVVVGAYRLGCGDTLVNRYGAKGLYTSTLFQFDAGFLPVLSSSLELGRSFVRVNYQQKPLPLFLLWQGILAFLQQNSQFRYIIGPVSISNDFSRFSKDLMITYIKQSCYDYSLAAMVHPRKEFKVTSNIDEIEVVLKQSANDIKQIDRFISGIEPSQMKIPVLLKKYLRQNAKIIGFNVDPKFNNSLDGLMVLDITNLPNDTVDFLQHR